MKPVPRALYGALLLSLLLHAALLSWTHEDEEVRASQPLIAVIQPQPESPAPHVAPAPQTPQEKPVARTRPSPRQQAVQPTAVAPVAPRSQEESRPAAAPPVAAPSAAQSAAETLPDEQLIARYRMQIHSMAARLKTYPDQARKRNWQGRVELHAGIDTAGQLRTLEVLKSSGYEVLDEEARAMLRKAQHDVPLPAELRGKSFDFRLTVLFELEG